MSLQPHTAVCARSREWASLRLDGELSALERRMLDGHLARCPECSAFASRLGGVAELLRSTESDTPGRSVDVSAFRRARHTRATRVTMRTTAAAAVVACAVAAGAVMPLGGASDETPSLLLVVAEDTELVNEGEVIRQERAAVPSQADAIDRGFREVL